MSRRPSAPVILDIETIEHRARRARAEAMQDMWNGLRRALRPSR